jgi:Lon protease-like protein
MNVASGEMPNVVSEALPATLPIFPLTGVLLLPRGQLPLNIFERRYLNMAEDALNSDRMIGMVQPLYPEADPVSERAEIYSVGCAGRIVSSTETTDGRMLITLAGVCRFRQAGELAGKRGYRLVTAKYGDFLADFAKDRGAAADRARLLAAVRNFFDLKEIDTDWAAIEEADDESLLTSLAMVCPLEPREKQALLECRGLDEQSELLTALLELAVRGAGEAAFTVKH